MITTRLRTRLRFALAAALALAAAALPAAQTFDGGPDPQPESADLAIVGGLLIDGHEGPPLPGAVVLVEGDRIVAVGRRGELTVPDGAEVVDARGMTILPGLIDAHVHLDILGHSDYQHWHGRYRDGRYAEIMAVSTRQLLMSGVTTAVDLAGQPDALGHIQARIESGELAGAASRRQHGVDHQLDGRAGRPAPPAVAHRQRAHRGRGARRRPDRHRAGRRHHQGAHGADRGAVGGHPGGGRRRGPPHHRPRRDPRRPAHAHPHRPGRHRAPVARRGGQPRHRARGPPGPGGRGDVRHPHHDPDGDPGPGRRVARLAGQPAGARPDAARHLGRHPPQHRAPAPVRLLRRRPPGAANSRHGGEAAPACATPASGCSSAPTAARRSTSTPTPSGRRWT